MQKIDLGEDSDMSDPITCGNRKTKKTNMPKIYPILTYSCEIWCLPTNKYKIDFKSIDNFEIEKVHLKFCKYILGVAYPKELQT